MKKGTWFERQSFIDEQHKYELAQKEFKECRSQILKYGEYLGPMTIQGIVDRVAIKYKIDKSVLS